MRSPTHLDWVWTCTFTVSRGYSTILHTNPATIPAINSFLFFTASLSIVFSAAILEPPWAILVAKLHARVEAVKVS